MDILKRAGKELLEIEASLAAVATPLGNLKDIQSHLQSWESERQGLREIINKDLAQANTKPVEKSTSSFASLSKLKLGSGTFLNKGASSEAKSKNDLMTRINGNRSRLDELDLLIKKEIQLVYFNAGNSQPDSENEKKNAHRKLKITKKQSKG